MKDTTAFDHKVSCRSYKRRKQLPVKMVDYLRNREREMLYFIYMHEIYPNFLIHAVLTWKDVRFCCIVYLKVPTQFL